MANDKKEKRKSKEKTPVLKKLEKKEIDFASVKRTRMKVIGIGGGGGNIVSEIISRLNNKNALRGKVSFVVANTDVQALKTTNKNAIRFQFGEIFTKGLGTGMNLEIARQAAENEKEKIKKLFQGQDLCILIASLGGGTGSGATPVFAKIAKNLGIITVGVFTLPFEFEGEEKLEIAKETIANVKPYLNAIIIIANEKIFQVIDKNSSLREALSSINKNLAESLQGLIETVYLPGLINIDFADLKTILQGKGRLAFLNTTEGYGNNNLMETIKNVLNCPFYFYNIRGAKGVIFNIAKEKGLSLSELSLISKSISELINPEAKIIFGISENKRYKDKIKVTLLATGCSVKNFFDEIGFKKLKKEENKKNIEKKEIKKEKEKEKKEPKKKELKKNLNNSLKKIKIKISPQTSETSEDKIPPSQEENDSSFEKKKNTVFSFWKNDSQIRKNGLQLKKETEKIEKELMAKEAIWETPAFLRKRLAKIIDSKSLRKKES